MLHSYSKYDFITCIKKLQKLLVVENRFLQNIFIKLNFY